MTFSEVSKRYAKALYELSKAQQKNDVVLAEIRALVQILKDDKVVADFVKSPLVSPENKTTAIKAAFSGKTSADVTNLLLLLASKNRLEIFSELVAAYEQISDQDHGVTRGTVRSASVLSADARKSIEATVAKATGKKVILNFVEDHSLLGGLVAQVGGWTFDDSLNSHLTRMSEDLNRRAN